MPPINNIIAIVDGQPETGSPKAIVRTIIVIMNINEKNDATSPNHEEINKGLDEKEVIPEIEYTNNCHRDHFVCPAARSTFSYDIYLVLKPTQEKIPFENLLYSDICKTAFTTCLVISLKSLTPSIIGTSESLFIRR